MLETFNARLAAEAEVEAGSESCPCVIFPEVSHNEEVRAVIDAAVSTLGESLMAHDVGLALYLDSIGAAAAVGHALTVAAAAGYALALDTLTADETGPTFDPDLVDWTAIPDISDGL